MSNLADDFPSIACVPSAIPKEKRAGHVALAKRLLMDAAVKRDVLQHGYAFSFALEEFKSVAAFVNNERRCCPFMRFEIVIEAHPPSVSLRMTGPEGTRELLDAELGLASCQATGCGCSASTWAELINHRACANRRLTDDSQNGRPPAASYRHWAFAPHAVSCRSP